MSALRYIRYCSIRRIKNLTSQLLMTRVGDLVYWLWEETFILNVMGSNLSTIYWMDIFLFIFCKHCNDCLQRQKYTKKRPGMSQLIKRLMTSQFLSRRSDVITKCRAAKLKKIMFFSKRMAPKIVFLF